MVKLSQLVQDIAGGDLEPGSRRQIESLESRLLGIKCCEYTQASYFGPGIWVRELRVPGRRPDNPLGNLIIGHAHWHANLNIMGAGEKVVVIGNRVERIVAPYCVLSGAGVRKVGLILEDMVWYSIHHNPTDERDEDALEEMFYQKSDTFRRHELRAAEERIHGLRHLLLKAA